MSSLNTLLNNGTIDLDTNNVFSVASQETNPMGIAFNNDGTKMFIVGYDGDNVYEYDLSTGFDVSTASYGNKNFSVRTQDTIPVGIAFNNDGTKMFIVGYQNADVNEYALSTGFDVSTAGYTRNFSVRTQETSPQGIAFNNDGTKMFIVGFNGDDVNEYALTTGFNLGDVNYRQNFSIASEETSPQGIAFNGDGTKMFIVGDNGVEVNEYDLSTGFNVSTASYANKNFSVASEERSPQGIAFNGDGTKMFIVGDRGVEVNEYDLSTGFDLSTTIIKYILNGNYTLSSNLTIGAGEILTIASGVTLTIPSGKTLTTNGTLINNGKLLSLVAKIQKKRKISKISKINIALSNDLHGQLQYAGQPILGVIQFKNIENQMVKFVLLDNDPNDPFTQIYKGVVINDAVNATEKKDLYRHYAKMYDGSRDVLLYLESLSGEELVYRGY